MSYRETAMNLAGKVLAIALSAVLVVACTPLAAFADEEEDAEPESETGTVDAGDGWVLDYEASDGEATITGVDESSAGSGSLAVPETVELSDGSLATVVELGPSAFDECSELTGIDLPDTLVILGKDSLRETGLASISIPASVAYIPPRCFRECTELAHIDFEDGSSPEYLGFGAFYGCSSLEEISIPPLTGDEYASERYTESATSASMYRVGLKCFYDCTNLSKIVFEAGGEGSYLKDGFGQIGNNAEDLKIVDYVKLNLTTSFGTSDAVLYFAMKYYESEEDYETDENGTQAAYTAVYEDGTSIYDAIYDSDSVSDAFYESEGSLPELDEGMVWGVSDEALENTYSTLDDVVEVYPVERENLDYGWVSSPEIDAAEEAEVPVSSSGYDPDNSNSATVFLDSDGIPDLSGMAAYAADGTKLDESLYELVYLQTVTDHYTKNLESYVGQVYPGEPWEEGTYEVYADGLDGTASEGTSTGDEEGLSPTGKSGVYFQAGYYETALTEYTGTSRSTTLGSTALATNSALESDPDFAVVASADSWQDALVASGLAAVGGGQAILTDGSSTSDYVYSAIAGSGAGKVYVVGGEAAVGSSVMDGIEGAIEAKDGAVSSIASNYADDPAALSRSVYESILKIADDYGYEWGDVAVVASQTQSLANSSVANYAYQAAAPVFLTEPDGSLSSEALSDIAEGGFEKVVVAGPSSYVPSSTYDAVKSETGAEVERLANASSAYEASVDMQEAVSEDFVDEEGEALADESSLVVASALDPAYVVAASQLAVASGCEFVTVATSADVKDALQRLYDAAGNAVDAVCLVGDFSDMDEALASAGSASTSELFTSIWTAVPKTSLAEGDTVEDGGVLYELTSSSGARALGLIEEGTASVSISTVSRGGRTYDVDTVVSSAFAGAERLKTATVSADAVNSKAFHNCRKLSSAKVTAESVGSSCFQGCASLKSATVSARTLGARAFKGCSSMTEAALSSKSMSSIPASAFQGCSKLASVSVSSAALTAVNSRAFYGCKALESVTLKSGRLKTIGSSAFRGCSSMTKASFPSKRLRTIGASAFRGCKKLKSISLASTRLSTVGAKAFSNCASLKSVKLKSKKLKTIGASAFQGCKKLKTVTVLSTSLKTIKSKAFYNCSKLQTIVLKSKKIQTVGTKAFARTSKKIKVKVPKAKTKSYRKAFTKKGLSRKAVFKKA